MASFQATEPSAQRFKTPNVPVSTVRFDMETIDLITQSENASSSDPQDNFDITSGQQWIYAISFPYGIQIHTYMDTIVDKKNG